MSSGRPFRTRLKWKWIDKNKMQASVTKMETVQGGVVIKEEKGVFHDKRENNKGKGKLLQEECFCQVLNLQEVVKTYKRGFDGKGKAIMVEFPGFDVENKADGDGVENRSGGAADIVPSGVNKRYQKGT